ncbi:MAG TPA: GPW/gp25 family protein [Vicinamibacterales bacterium]
MSSVDFPFHFDGRGRTASADADDHLRDLIRQVLFTAPGERVMRPTFGCGLMQLVFAPNSEELGAATQLVVQAALQEWLADRIQVNTVEVQAEDATLRVRVDYTVLRSQQRRVEEFSA